MSKPWNCLKDIECVSDIMMQLINFRTVSTSAVHVFPSTGSSDYFYRGESNFLWNSCPSIFRNYLYTIEHELIQEALQQYPSDFPNPYSNPIATLAKLQHYGLSSRLLDITSSPLVALYFACQSYKVDNVEQDGKLIIFRGCAFYSDSIMPRILAHLAFHQLSNEPLVKDEYDMQHFQVPGISSKDYREIIKKDIIVRSPLTFERINRQLGAFIIWGNGDVEGYKQPHFISENCWKTNETFYSIVKIPAKAKHSLLYELSVLGIDKHFLFPELEAGLDYINQNKMDKSFVLGKNIISSFSNYYDY